MLARIPSRTVLSRAQDIEKSKVLQSIASVIQALPAEEEVSPVEVRVMA